MEDDLLIKIEKVFLPLIKSSIKNIKCTVRLSKRFSGYEVIFYSIKINTYDDKQKLYTIIDNIYLDVFYEKQYKKVIVIYDIFDELKYKDVYRYINKKLEIRYNYKENHLILESTKDKIISDYRVSNSNTFFKYTEIINKKDMKYKKIVNKIYGFDDYTVTI